MDTHNPAANFTRKDEGLNLFCGAAFRPLAQRNIDAISVLERNQTMTISDVNIALTGKTDRLRRSAPAGSLGLMAGLQAYRAYQALAQMTAQERRRAGISKSELPRIAARHAKLIA